MHKLQREKKNLSNYKKQMNEVEVKKNENWSNGYFSNIE